MCNCIKEINEQMEDLNTTIDSLFINRASIRTRKLDVKIKGNKAEVIVEFCPFCGENYLKEEEKAKKAAKITAKRKGVNTPTTPKFGAASYRQESTTETFVHDDARRK